jgi:hypothetical protein
MLMRKGHRKCLWEKKLATPPTPKIEATSFP